MRPILARCTFLLFPFLSLPAFAQQSLDVLIERELPKLLETYRHLHMYPEVSYQEEKTSAFLAKELRELGFEVTERFGTYPEKGRTCHGVVAIMKNGSGPTVLVRTDMDALPVEEKTGLPYASTAKTRNDAGQEVSVMQACGHDLHMSSFLGTAAVLSKVKDRCHLIPKRKSNRGKTCYLSFNHRETNVIASLISLSVTSSTITTLPIRAGSTQVCRPSLRFLSTLR